MREDFKPEVIIGSVVAANPGKPKENDLMSQLENMIMQKTDYTLPDSLGIIMTFKYDDVSLLDFNRLQELHDIDYQFNGFYKRPYSSEGKCGKCSFKAVGLPQ